MEVNLVAVLAATVAMFAAGAVWYMALFSKQWGEIHGFEKLSKSEQKEMQSKMGPYYGAQMVVTFVSAWVLAFFLAALPNVVWYTLAFLLWLGFIVPAEVSAVIFGGTEGRWILSKIVISIGGSLVALLVGAYVISLF
jgi:fatty acid desaturase